MAACAWNMAKWMREAILLLFALLFKLKKIVVSKNVRLSQAIKAVETDLGGISNLGDQNFRLFQD